MRNSSLTWVKSSYSGSQGGNCVEVAADTKGGILVRDTKDRAGAVLGFRQASWHRFAAEIKAGRQRVLAIPESQEQVRGRPPTGGRPLLNAPGCLAAPCCSTMFPPLAPPASTPHNCATQFRSLV